MFFFGWGWGDMATKNLIESHNQQGLNLELLRSCGTPESYLRERSFVLPTHKKIECIHLPEQTINTGRKKKEEYKVM